MGKIVGEWNVRVVGGGKKISGERKQGLSPVLRVSELGLRMRKV